MLVGLTGPRRQEKALLRKEQEEGKQEGVPIPGRVGRITRDLVIFEETTRRKNVQAGRAITAPQAKIPIAPIGLDTNHFAK